MARKGGNFGGHKALPFRKGGKRRAHILPPSSGKKKTPRRAAGK